MQLAPPRNHRTQTFCLATPIVSNSDMDVAL